MEYDILHTSTGKEEKQMKKRKADALPEILKELLENADVEYITIKIKPKHKITEQGENRTEAKERG